MKFPQQGRSPDVLLAQLQAQKSHDVRWQEGRVFAYIYDAGEEARQLLKDAFNLYMMENGLDPTSFPSCLELEKDVIGMAVDLVNGGADATGTFTSGGTESILLSLKTTRDFYRDVRPDITAPEILLPKSAHPAFHKACQYFDLKAVTVDVDDNFCAIPELMEAAISPNTILMVGSAPSYAHGAIDPLQGGMVAHPKIEPGTGTIFTFGYWGHRAGLTYHVLGSDGARRSARDHPVEELLQVHIHYNPPARLYVRLRGQYRVLRTPPRPKAVAVLAEGGVQNWLQHLQQCLLDQPIRQRRNTECPHPALRLGDVHPTNCLRDVRPRQQLGLDRWPVLLKVGFERQPVDPIDPGCALVPYHSLIRRPKVAAFAHGFHQSFRFRFRPRTSRRIHLDTQRSPLRIPSGPCYLRSVLPTDFCPDRCHRGLIAYSRSSTFGPSAHPGAYYGLC